MSPFQPQTDMLLAAVPELADIAPRNYPAMLAQAQQTAGMRYWPAVLAGLCFLAFWGLMMNHYYQSLPLLVLLYLGGDYLYCRALRPALLAQLAAAEQASVSRGD